MLKAKNVVKKFGGITALDNCSFEIKKGKITALVGPNGSGKTTFFNIVSGILKPDRGKIIFNGKNIVGLKPHIISNLGLSRTFQETRLFDNLTVRENLVLAADNEDTSLIKSILNTNKINKRQFQKIENILSILSLKDKEHALSKKLSFGQKKLLELSRALVNPHKMIMLDEPVSGVNPAVKSKIKQIILNLKKNKETILLIEHDMHFVLSIADLVIVLDQGRKIAEGKPEDIRKDKRVLEAYLGG